MRQGQRRSVSANIFVHRFWVESILTARYSFGMILKAQWLALAVYAAGVFTGGCANPNQNRLAGELIPTPPVNLPKIQREFRGVWVATVGNSDWPSKPNLPVAQQKEELLAILNNAQRMRLNVVVFQVRPGCDALYASKIEPWSEYLTGTMGKAPSPLWDPLEFAIDEAHKRGLELHAWFNPYRAYHFNAKSPISANHVSKTKPQIVTRYGRYLWLDPGERETQDYSLSVVMDVVNRYDVDGIHFDDYFYPYAEKGADGKELDFPDDNSRKKFGANSGMTRDDWRRENVNTFIQRVHTAIKAQKPWVKFGISPFGIWRPGNPPQIKGYDAHDKLYADARKWLVQGWADYFVPQLYWAIEPKEQSFTALWDWWNEQNVKRRIMCAGVDATKGLNKWPVQEIPNQIAYTRKLNAPGGYVLWNMKHTAKNENLSTRLRQEINQQPALVPELTWIERAAPNQPVVKLTGSSSPTHVTVNWSGSSTEDLRFWCVQSRTEGGWTTEIMPVERTSIQFPRATLDAVSITAIGRTGIASKPAIVNLQAPEKSGVKQPPRLSSPKMN
jgi:uncharacterized lipoprotein YddW (UPF0748 family)